MCKGNVLESKLARLLVIEMTMSNNATSARERASEQATIASIVSNWQLILNSLRQNLASFIHDCDCSPSCFMYSLNAPSTSPRSPRSMSSVGDDEAVAAAGCVRS